MAEWRLMKIKWKKEDVPGRLQEDCPVFYGQGQDSQGIAIGEIVKGRKE